MAVECPVEDTSTRVLELLRDLPTAVSFLPSLVGCPVSALPNLNTAVDPALVFGMKEELTDGISVKDGSIVLIAESLVILASAVSSCGFAALPE